MAPYEVLETPLPGITIVRMPGKRNLYARIYKQATQETINRSTGSESLQDAKKWLLDNFQSLVTAEATPKGGSLSSITRMLTRHSEWQRQRCEAGFISESTYQGYAKNCRHFIRWFDWNGFKKLGDIQRTSLLNYGQERITVDGMSPNTVQLEIVCIKAFWRWLQDEEILDRPLRINPVQKAVENRTGTEPFANGDLKVIHKTINEWVRSKDVKANFGGNKIRKYNKYLFQCFIELLDESGARQHEVWNRTWKDIKIGETLSKRHRIINQIKIPQKAKRGARTTVFRGESLVRIKDLHKSMCVNPSPDDFIFRAEQTNTLIDISTFSRYWNLIKDECEMNYVLHTFRSHRITQLIMCGVEPQLVARNLGLSIKQIEDSYLRFAPAGHFNKLVQDDLPSDKELKSLM